MWDRFRGAVPQKPGRVQQQQQHANVYAGGYSYSIQGGPPPPRPPREFMEQQMQFYQDEAPPVQPAQDPPPLNPNRDSSFRPASSIYSQPSPIHTNFATAQPPPAKSYTYDPTTRTHTYREQPVRSYTRNDIDDISPPSSPETFTPRDGVSHPAPDISPIDEETAADMMPQQPATGQQIRGNIPSLRRERRHKMDAAASVLRESKSRDRLQPPQVAQPRPPQQSARGYHGGEVRWDPSTGELTSSEKGRPSQVKPAEYVKGLLAHGAEQRRPEPEHQAAPRDASASFGERVRKIAQPGFMTGGEERSVLQEHIPPRQPQQPPSQASSLDPAAGAFTTDRPGWKGASGRTTLVDPVRDTPDVAPLNIPRKSSKRAGARSGPGGQASQRMDTIMSSPPVSPIGAETRETIRPVVPSSQLLPSQHERERHHSPAADYPSPPHSGGGVDAPHLAIETANELLQPQHQPAPHHLQSPGSLSPTAATAAIRRKPAPSSSSPPHHHHQQQDSVSSVYSQSDPYNYKNYLAANPPPPGVNPTVHLHEPPDPWTQPPSRFSVTTYATSAQSTPRPSTDGFNPADAPPMPTDRDRHLGGGNSSSSTIRQQQQPESVMDRRRPKLLGHAGGSSGSSPTSSDDEPIVISLKDGGWKPGAGSSSAQQHQHRKPVQGGGGGGGRAPPTTTTRPESIASMAGSIYKQLPPAPPESSAKDRVARLNAQLQGLANRRINITRSIKQMTELMPTDNIMASAEVLHKREVERRKVEALRAELAEVQREEYELGIKLHRAYKRMDRDATFEPTTLWVRRVTG